MKLKRLSLTRFRGYSNRVEIELENLTAFVGRNDAGKSSVLEALDVFFNGVKLVDPDDLSVGATENSIEICCVFNYGAKPIVIDAQAQTDLRNEYLLNADGDLEILKKYKVGSKVTEEVYLCCHQPANNVFQEIHSLTITKLKNLADQLQVDLSSTNKSSKVELRSAIFASQHVDDLRTFHIRADKAREDMSQIWSGIQSELPIYALFKSDRPSKDDDPEVQDPLKIAVQEVVKELSSELEKIKEEVRLRATDVAKRTLRKLQDMDPTLASELMPSFKAEPGWAKLFNLTLSDESGVSINKRGSGVRRLILINFFRAETERRQEYQKAPMAIFAIEEPETSQHPKNQRMLIEALKELSEQASAQVLLTTHVPGLAGLLPRESIRLVEEVERKPNVRDGKSDDSVIDRVADSLGILPDRKISVFVLVEGPGDVKYLNRFSKILASVDKEIEDFESSPYIATIPTGGQTLQQWVEFRYLAGTDIRQFWLFDRGTNTPPKFESECKKLQGRPEVIDAVLTQKMEIENYLDNNLVNQILEIDVKYGDMDDVPLIVARELHNADSCSSDWDSLTDEQIKRKMTRVKKRLCDMLLPELNHEYLNAVDPNNEIRSWLRTISKDALRRMSDTDQ